MMPRFFADASLSYLTKSSENRIDLFLLTAGFRFDSNKLSGAALSGTKYFFCDNSYSIQSEIEADISAIISYDLIYLKLPWQQSYFSTNSNTDF
jgi:hypothetical protein